MSVQTKQGPSGGACEPPAWVRRSRAPQPCPAALGPPQRMGWARRTGANAMPPGNFSSSPLPPSPLPPSTAPHPGDPHLNPASPTQSPRADASLRGCTVGWGFPWALSVPLASTGEVNITVSTQALSSRELCGNETPVVPVQGHVDTIIKPLLVQVRWVMVEERGMGLGSGCPQC